MLEFLKAKFDNISLVFILVLFVGVLMWFQDRADDKVVAWFEQTITTVLGAYIGLTQAGRIAWNKQGGTNGTQGSSTSSNVVAGTK